jgi:hypothetical protein
MGIIREPKGVDFIIQSPPPTEEELKEISEFIKERKRQRQAKRKARVRTGEKTAKV